MPEKVRWFRRICWLLALWASVVEGVPFRPNIILITIDTFRPDHIGYDGYPLETSPHLDAISGEGVFFKQAFSSSGWTTPGLISILTSLYAPTHAVDIRGRRLDPEVVTLPEVLREAGYRAPNIFFLTEIPNFSHLGLEPYDRRDELIDQGDEIFFNWLEEEGGKERPFFLYYHYRDLHLPYNPGEPYESMFLPAAFESAFGFLGTIKRFIAAEKLELVKKSVMLTRGILDFAPRDRPWVRALYDAEIRRLDTEFFARLRRVLKQQGLDRNSLVIISADHGEELLDRDLIGHVSTFKEGRIYDEIIRIPLIFWLPDVMPAGRVIEAPVQCIDVMPTVLDLLDLPLPEGGQGRSLLPLIEGDPGWVNKPIFIETSGAGYTADEEQYRQRFRAVRSERWKLIYASPEKAHYLYDLVDDPGERRDVAKEFPQIADSLRTLLNEWVLYTQRRPYAHREAAADTIVQALIGTGEQPRILFPQDGDTLHYQGGEHLIRLRWSGPATAPYAIEYDVGEGAYHLEGVITESSSAPSYGPFQANFWNSLVLYNPWKFRIYREDLAAQKSEWVTFYLASSEAGKQEFSWLRAVLQVREGIGSAVVHAGNLAWGLGRGLIDLYLWIGSVPAADLSAYALLLVIAGAVLWPQAQRLGVERCRAWGLALLYVTFVYSTIPLMPRVWGALSEYTEGSGRYLGILLVVAVGAVLVTKVWRRVGRRRWSPYLALAVIGPIYVYLLREYAIFPSERLHLVEYGFMGWFLFRALRIDLSARGAYAAAFAGTVLLGIGDECIQWILPQRFFEVKDVQLNAISGGLGLLLLRFVVSPSVEERSGPERTAADV